MWQELTPEEKDKSKRQRERRALKMGFFVFLFGFIVSPLGDKFIGETYERFQPIGNKLTWIEIYGRLTHYILAGLAIGIFIYIFLRKSKESTYICMKCGKSKNFDKVLTCDCGGEFKNISELKWVE